MDLQTIETFIKVGGGLSACGVLFLVCVFLSRLHGSERDDRRKAWSEVSRLTEKHNDTMLKNIEAISGITNVIEDLKNVIHSKK